MCVARAQARRGRQLAQRLELGGVRLGDAHHRLGRAAQRLTRQHRRPVLDPRGEHPGGAAALSLAAGVRPILPRLNFTQPRSLAIR